MSFTTYNQYIKVKYLKDFRITDFINSSEDKFHFFILDFLVQLSILSLLHRLRFKIESQMFIEAKKNIKLILNFAEDNCVILLLI